MPLSLLKKEDSHEFKPLLAEIEEDPGSPLGPITFWVIVAVFLFFLAWAIWGQVDIVVSARGKVIPSGQVKLVQPLNGGVVNRILVKEGDLVHKGQPLVEIDPSTTAPELEFNQKTLSHVQMELQRLQAETGNGSFHSSRSTQGRLYQASVASLEKQLSAKDKQLENLNAQIQAKHVEVKNTREMLNLNIDKEKRLQVVKDIIAKDDYDKVQNDIQSGQNKLKTLEHELAQLDFQKQQTVEEMGYLEQNFNSTTLNDLSEKEKQINQLKASIEEASFKNSRQTLLAPVDGYVNELFIHTMGGVVTPAQKILSIVPVNMPLVIQATAMNQDIGFIKKDMPVSIKVDTYEFQKYGTLKGIVSRVDKDSKDDQKLGPVYTVIITPLQKDLLVDGHWQSLSSGLSVTAEVKTGKRHIIEFFIYPLIKHLNEGMSVR